MPKLWISPKKKKAPPPDKKRLDIEKSRNCKYLGPMQDPKEIFLLLFCKSKPKNLNIFIK